MKKNSALQIAKYIVEYAYKEVPKISGFPEIEGESYNLTDLSHIKLQEILYFAYGFYYSHTKKELFDANFRSFKYGPKIDTVYDLVKKEIRTPDEILKKDIFANIDDSDLRVEKSVLDEILNVLLKLSTWKLVNISNEKNSPLYLNVNSEILKKEVIHKYFIELNLKS